MPLAFTEHGVAMLSSVLRSPRAIQVNIEIMRAFSRRKLLLAEQSDLAKRLTEIEKRFDSRFKVVFDALRRLIEGPVRRSRRIGFRP